ncbi:protein scaf8 [Anaeramoeba ignava]|uniref:Protein scaf8 n=1 Tax=Anaeramoeba ignava TaxID=1746090 RepID=A0A9Q0LIS0_ANAIG|nr:protein scaf8 [Anaeramoeba ignava]
MDQQKESLQWDWEGSKYVFEQLTSITPSTPEANKIQAISTFAVENHKNFKFVVATIENFAQRVAKDSSLVILYSIDSIVKKSQQTFKENDLYTKEFEKNLEMLIYGMMESNDQFWDPICKVISIWKKHNIFDADLLDRIIWAAYNSDAFNYIEKHITDKTYLTNLPTKFGITKTRESQIPQNNIIEQTHSNYPPRLELSNQYPNENKISIQENQFRDKKDFYSQNKEDIEMRMQMKQQEIEKQKQEYGPRMIPREEVDEYYPQRANEWEQGQEEAFLQHKMYEYYEDPKLSEDQVYQNAESYPDQWSYNTHNNYGPQSQEVHQFRENSGENPQYFREIDPNENMQQRQKRQNGFNSRNYPGNGYTGNSPNFNSNNSGNITTLFIRNIKNHEEKENLEEILSKYTGFLKFSYIDHKGIAFVRFEQRDQAQHAMHEMQDTQTHFQFAWARPRKFGQKFTHSRYNEGQNSRRYEQNTNRDGNSQRNYTGYYQKNEYDSFDSNGNYYPSNEKKKDRENYSSDQVSRYQKSLDDESNQPELSNQQRFDSGFHSNHSRGRVSSPYPRKRQYKSNIQNVSPEDTNNHYYYEELKRSHSFKDQKYPQNTSPSNGDQYFSQNQNSNQNLNQNSNENLNQNSNQNSNQNQYIQEFPNSLNYRSNENEQNYRNNQNYNIVYDSKDSNDDND